MDLEKDKVIGIVGGMGPGAGLALFNRILSSGGACSDQEHLSVMLMSFPKHIVDRTAFLEGAVRTNPAYSVASIIEKLERAGAKVIGIACNTCHAPEIFNVIGEELGRTCSGVELLNMPAETCRYIQENYRQIRRIGLMTTNGAYKARIYESLLLDLGFEVVMPDPVFQDRIIHRMIYDPGFGIKANSNRVCPEVRLLMREAMGFFRSRNTEAVVLGCTELSAIIDEGGPETDLILVDSIEALALALIREATRR